MNPSRSPRPPSPTGSSVSRASAVSMKSTISTAKKQVDRPSTLTAAALASLPPAKSAISQMSIDDCMAFVSQPHRTWESAYKEMARMESNRERLESDARSCCSTISAYSIPASVTTARSSKAARKGHLGMLPLGGQESNTITDPRIECDLQLTGRSTTSAHGRPTSMHSTKGFQFTGVSNSHQRPTPMETSGGDEDVSVCSTRSSVAGAPGGRSGIRRQNGGAMSAPTAARGAGRGPPRSVKRTPSQAPQTLDLQIGGTGIR